MEISDNQLVSRILKGDTNTFATLVDRYNSQIFNLMYRYSGSTEEAADMTQDVFLKSFEKLESYREQRFFSWLYTLALNHAKDWSRKRQTNEQKLARLKHDSSTNEQHASGELESQQENTSLLKALETLSPDNKEMVLLKYQHDHSIRELSEIFNLSESAVKMRLHRSLAEVRTVLTGD
ncbi:RNA polymerase sigma factor [Desulfosediminicola flagellatus]|uniref:RNA polymerase sigma factor n=1 Tax=Desulfosediminicola flagellatus TaxID=2569541 RepID=UPI0010ABE0E8|nr:RNA polymerase sigma factor [Desulfosediminicola flagellatus]